VIPLLEERLFVIGRADLAGMPAGDEAALTELAGLPLVLPSGSHTLRTLVLEGFRAVGQAPEVVVEVDGVGSLMDVVRDGVGASIQPGSLLSRLALDERGPARLRAVPLRDATMVRRSLLASLSDDELSPAGLAARVVITELARELVQRGDWAGAGPVEAAT
jgi:LysR family tcuABC transcriptional regulator